jgi:hypothetical protein
MEGGQSEEVEPDVAVKNRVLDAEGVAVQPEEPGLPSLSGGDAEPDGDDGGRRREDRQDGAPRERN